MSWLKTLTVELQCVSTAAVISYPSGRLNSPYRKVSSFSTLCKNPMIQQSMRSLKWDAEQKIFVSPI